MEKKLNLGCGAWKKEGFVNIDYFDYKTASNVDGPDIVHDLNVLPYPFTDNEFDLIEADHVMEHLNDVFAVMKELHRISKNGASIKISVPHFSRGFTHADHRRGFDVTFPYYFNPSFIYGYQGFKLELVDMKLAWFAQPYFKKKVLPLPMYLLGMGISSVLSFLANLSPLVCSRFWCFWVGGFEEIEFRFRVVK